MDPNQKEFPILSYLLWRMDPGTHPPLPREAEQTLLIQYPHLTNPEVVSSLSQSIPSIITQTHLLLKALGPRPDPDAVSAARIKMGQIRETGETSKDLEIYKAVVRLEEMHEEYQRQLREAEQRLVGVYKEVAGNGEVNEEVVEILKESEKGAIVERIDLSGRQLRLIPEAFGKLRGLIALKLCNNELEILPDSIAELEKLEVLDVSSNLLQTLPDTIGLLRSLKVLKVAGNRLTVLPESIALCSSLVELDASFNSLICLPTNIGYGLVNLERLSVQLNKIRFFPQSICEMKSLRYLDAHFNELHGLPHAIGRLTNLEILNLSSNFNDFTELPETIGALTNLRELDLSNNQIRVLPSTFGGLEKLTKLNLDENPLLIPPKEIVSMGIEAVMEYIKKRREELIAAEELQRNVIEANRQQAETGWLAWGTSMLNTLVSGVSQGVSRYLGGADAPKDPYIDQQL